MREGRARTHAFFLALLDGLMVLFAMQLAWWLRFDINNWWATVVPRAYVPFDTGWTPGQPYFLAVFVTLPVFWLILREMNLYAEPEDGTGEFFRLGAAVFIATLLLAALGFYARNQSPQDQFQFSRAYMLLFLPTSFACLYTARTIYRFSLRQLSRKGIGQNRILMVGAGYVAEELAKELAARGTNHVVGTLQVGPYAHRDEATVGPISKLACSLLEEATVQHASTIRLSAKSEHIRVAFDLGGSETEQKTIPISSREALFERMARMAQTGGGRIQYWRVNPKFQSEWELTKEADDVLEFSRVEASSSAGMKTPAREEGALKVIGHVVDLADLATHYDCDEVVVACPGASKESLKQIAEDCYRAHIRFRMVPDVYEMMLDHMDLALVGDIPLLGMRGSRIEGVNFVCKRLFDIAVSFVLLLILVPTVFLATAIAIKLSSRGPIFYSQERLGFRRRTFRFWKFRSMRTDADKGLNVEQHRDYLKKYIAGKAEAVQDKSGDAVFKLAEDPRVTRVGRFIRKYSIDELPQIWNVLVGDMSLIGPRPPIAYEVENYRPIHLRRFEVLPGISGLWQVSGRNRLTFEEMVKLDLYYIENWSLELDIRILFKTVSVVLFQRAH
jgi:exopolysaccharide biosynthesis polyprenyl glycosylphosphotransferase